MDNSANGLNKLIVLLAVGLIGAAAGQHLLKSTAPPVQQMGPWGPGYAMQQSPVGYAPMGYAQPAYGVPPMAAPYAVNGQMPQFPQPMPSVVDQTTARHSDAAGSSPSHHIAPSVARRADTLVRRAGYSPETEPSVPSPTSEERELDGVDLAFTSTEPARSLSTTLAPVVLGQSVGSLPKPEIAYIEVQEVLWNQSYDKVLLSSRTANLYLRISGTVQEKTKVVATDATIEIAPSSPLPNVFGEIYGPVPFTVAGDTTSVVLAVTLVRDGSAKSDASRKVTLYLPTLTGGPSAGTILAKTNRLKVPKSAAGGIDLYEGFLEVSGTGSTGASQIVVVACAKSVQLRDKYEPIAVRQTPTRPDSNGKWATKPDLSGLPNPEGQLLILAEGDQSKYAYATPIKFTLKASASVASSQLSIDSITQHDGGSGATFVAMPGERGNQRRLKITGTVPIDPPVEDGMAVLLVNGKEIDDSKQDLADAVFVYDKWTTTADGVYEFRIGIVQGDQISQSDPQSVEIRRTGPRVTGIAPDNLALTPGVNVIDVQFSAPLDRDSVFKEQFEFTGGLTVTSANLIAGNKVRLVLGDVKAGAYTLTVKPQLGTKPLRNYLKSGLPCAESMSPSIPQQGAGELNEAEMIEPVLVVADEECAALRQPPQRAFDHPATRF